MAMTMKVYEVSRDGLTRIVREEAEAVPLEQPEASNRFPACECPECKTPASHEGDRMTTHTAQPDGGKHGGQPSDKPWVPDPQPAPSPDGNRPQKRTEQ
ncbi:hypothetical protein [Streptomyces griseus]|uniref:hypothetical protein n=1 Tax=Streptomyces griseus TaxID=1911 RepID=UPI00364EDA09